MRCLFISLFFAIPFSIFGAIGSPLLKDSDTTALWNFDSDTPTSVLDSADTPITGAATSTTQEAIPGIDSAYGLARKFTSTLSGISFGAISGTKLDFTDDGTLSIEAVIRLKTDALNNHVIFDNGQIHFLVIGNKLAGFVKQEAGFVGVTAKESFSLNTNYKVAWVLGNNRLGLFIDGKNVGAIVVDEDIASAESSAVAAVGGNFLGQFFPGHIDNIRISSVTRGDNIAPVVEITAPLHDSIINSKRPMVSVTLSDVGTGIDTASVKVFVNDILQNNFTISATSVSGVVEQDISSNIVNRIVVQVSDLSGNLTEESVNVFLRLSSEGLEYTSDENTLLLFHMNDFVSWQIHDSSPNGHHATNHTGRSYVARGDGIFDAGKRMTGGGYFEVPFVAIPDQAFTFEVWLRPEVSGGDKSLFNSPQLQMIKKVDGRIGIILKARNRNHSFESTDMLFPANETHHLAVTWDGTKDQDNLVVYRDGVFRESFNAPKNCDFIRTPNLIKIGENYQGMMDELRFSSVVRTSFNMVTHETGIVFTSPTHKSSTLSSNPTFNISFNFMETISPNDVSIYLNGEEQTSSKELTVTASGIVGTMEESLTLGFNSITVVLTDAVGNQRKKSIGVFYIENLGGLANTATDDTVVLLDFESDRSIVDRSPQNISFTFGQRDNNGLIGNALKSTIQTHMGEKLGFSERSFTIEFMFKKSVAHSPSTFIGLGEQIYGRYAYFNNQIYMNMNALGDMVINFSNTDGRFNQTVARAVPNDGLYHHIAWIHDADRDHDNSLVLVDGEIKYVGDFECYCDVGPYELKLSFSDQVNQRIDEFMITNKAKYSFNIDRTSKPTISSKSGLIAGQTASSETPSVNYTFSDPDGIDQINTYFLVNGVRQTQLSGVALGNNFTLSGTINPLNFGFNEVEIHFRDLEENAQVHSFSLFYLESLTPAEYTTDDNTLALYHLNEASGATTLADSSGNANSITGFANVRLGATGVFNTGLELQSGFSGLPATIEGLQGLSNYTMEMWYKPSSHPYAYLFKVRNLALLLHRNGLYFIDVNNGWHHIVNNLSDFQETVWKHIAFVVDGSGDNRTIFVFIDGQKRVEYSIAASLVTLPSNSVSFMHSNSGSPTGYLIDEIRVSDTARLSFVNTLPPEEEAGDEE